MVLIRDAKTGQWSQPAFYSIGSVFSSVSPIPCFPGYCGELRTKSVVAVI